MMDMSTVLVVAMVAMMVLMMGGMLAGVWRGWVLRRRKRSGRTEQGPRSG
jgi:hypothetical protein